MLITSLSPIVHSAQTSHGFLLGMILCLAAMVLFCVVCFVCMFDDGHRRPSWMAPVFAILAVAALLSAGLSGNAMINAKHEAKVQAARTRDDRTSAWLKTDFGVTASPAAVKAMLSGHVRIVDYRGVATAVELLPSNHNHVIAVIASTIAPLPEAK
jgi:tellurite resistance protein TehA-like permease